MYNLCVPLEYQSYGVMMCVKGMNQWTNPMGHVQRTYGDRRHLTRNLMHVQRTNPYGTVHVATCTYARSQARALCQVRRTSYTGTQHAQRVVVKRNTCTEDNTNTQRVGTSNLWPTGTNTV